MTDTTKLEAVVFEAAMAVDDPQQRLAMIDAACRDQPGLKERIEELLAASEGANSFIQQPAVDFADQTTDSHPVERPGATIDRYKLLEQIGEGGFGNVFMADQISPVVRRVALKDIKPGMDTKQVIARFEAERQALALMDHPNIGKILDAGATQTGRPFFVMELVRGIPITEYCDQRKTLNQRKARTFCRSLRRS